MMKKLLSLLVLFLLSMSIFSITAFAQNTGQEGPPIYFDGKNVNLDQAAFYIDESSRTMVRYDFFQQLLKVDSTYLDDWNPLCSATWSESQGTVTLGYGGRTAKFTLGAYRYYIDNVEYRMDASIVKKDSTAYLPLRDAANALGIAIEWNGALHRIDLRSPTLQYKPLFFTVKDDHSHPLQVIKAKAISDFSVLPNEAAQFLREQYPATFFQKKALVIIAIKDSASAIKHKVTAVDVGAETIVVHISTLNHPCGGWSDQYVALEVEPWLLDKEIKVQQQVADVSDYYPLGSAIKDPIKSLRDLNDSRALPKQAIMVDVTGARKTVSGMVYDQNFFKKQFILCIWIYDCKGGFRYSLQSIDDAGDTVNIVLSRKGQLVYTQAIALSRVLLILDQDWAKKELSVSILDDTKNP